MMPETAKRTARVPILGEDGRISDDYIPAAIGEGVESAEAAAKRAETAATAAEGSATAAGQSASGAQGSASAAGTSATQAQESAATASGAATQAQSAQQAAEAAKTGAESARDSAQTAATQAQQSAASVADKYIASAQATTLDPGSQATASVADQVLTIGVPKGEKGDKGDPGEKGDTGTGVPEGGTPGQLLSKTDSGTAWVDPPSGNVLTGEVEGYVAHAEDAFPQKPREVRIKGKTWVNRWAVINGTNNGVTVSTDETGLITIEGTPTRNVTIVSAVIHTIRPNTKYSWSITSAISTNVNDASFAVVYLNQSETTNLGNNHFGTSLSGTFTSAAFDDTYTVRVEFYIGTTSDLIGKPFSWKGRVMLVDGTEAPDCFTPPASIASVETGKLVTSGKNLISFGPDTPKKTSNKNINDGDILVGVTTSGYVYPNSITGLEVNDGSITATSSSSGYGVGFVRYLPKGTTFTVSGKVTGNGRVTFTYVSHDKIVVNRASYGESDTTTTGKVPSDCVGIVVLVRNALDGYPVSFTAIPQLELGSTATPYEPPNITQTALPEVELRSLSNGTCDELVIKADGTCEVERKTGYIASYTDEEVTGEYVSTGNGLEAGASIVYELDEPVTEPQTSVTLPTLPAPTFNQYHDADVPSDTSTEYVRDINIVLDNLAKQVAGTASAVAVREASTIEEE